MIRHFENQDIQTLLNLYLQEARAFSAALKKGASWEELRAKRKLIKEINEVLNRKYEQSYTSKRRRDPGAPNE